MRSGLTARIVVFLFAAAGLAATAARAADAPPVTKPEGVPATLERPAAIAGATDERGIPVSRGVPAGPANSPAGVAKGFPVTRKIQRGQAFWPYETRPPYNAVDQRVEFLGEDEIQVNGVVTLNARAPQAVLQVIPADLRLDPNLQPSQAEGFYLVKIAGFTRTQKEVDALTGAGAVLGEFINVNTYIAKIPSEALGRVRALSCVTAVLDYQPAFKLGPRIGLEAIPESVALDPGTGRLRPWAFQLVLHKGADVEETLRRLAAAGVFASADQVVGNDEIKVVTVEAWPEQLIAMAHVPGIKWISELGFAEPHASATNPTVIPMLLQNNGAYTTSTGAGWKLWNAGIDGNRSGTAQVVTVMDSGLTTTSELFAHDTLNVGTLGAAHRKVVGYDVYGGGDLCVNAEFVGDGGHGNWVSQHAVGSISNMTSNPDTTHLPNVHWDNGIARDAKLYFQDVALNASSSVSPPLDLTASILAAIGKGSWIQNHSWGAAIPTYDTQPSFLDGALYANPDFVVAVSAGNRGAAGGSTIGNVCTSKNAICVGGNDAANPNNLFIDCNYDGVAACSGDNDLGSSRGPVATSNRVKPDICTFVGFSATVGGEQMAGILSRQMCQTDATKTVYWDFSNINFFGGTSFASPEVAGLAALVRDYFQSGFYPSGSANPADAITPSGALVKAVILASGEDMLTAASPTSSIAVAKRYSNDVGYGRANLPGVLHVGSGAPFLWVRNNDALGDSATRTFYYNINGNTMPLRVMLAWYDAAGNVIQKDADLRVTVGGKSYWGNDLVGGWGNPSSTLRDHTNNTEGVFLDAAHGLPASGTVQVDVIGYSNPGGMTFSLVVAGDVASQDVVQVSLDKGKYTCLDEARITVNDAGATSPVSVIVTSRDSGGNVLDTETVTCAGGNGVFTGSLWTGSGITVSDGGTLTAAYAAANPAVSDLDCNVTVADAGYLVQGGCDNAAAGSDIVAGPLSNGGSNEYYNRYMDGGEYSSYTVGFVNQTGVDLSDVYVHLSFSGPGASKMLVFNNPVKIGGLPADGLSGAVFQVHTDPSVAGLTSVDFHFDITSPIDGYTTPVRLTQTRFLQANDQISRQQQCSTFDTALAPWYESILTCTGCVGNPWRWTGSATNPATVGSETRVDGSCGSGISNAALMVGNSGTSTTSTNFRAKADSMALLRFQPALRGNGPNGQPYHFVWRWHSFYHASEEAGDQSGAWGVFYNHEWNSTTNPTADQARNFPLGLGMYAHTVFDYAPSGTGSWNWDAPNGGTPDDPRLGPSSGGAPNQLFITFGNAVEGLATDATWFAYGHEHGDITLFGGTDTSRRDVALDNDRLVYDQYYTAAQAGASCGAGGQVGQVAFDRYSYDDCPAATAVVSVLDPNAVAPLQVTVISAGTGDSEVVTLTGAAPYFSGAVTLATDTGRGANNGTLFVLPGERLQATYTDAAPAGSSTAFAFDSCPGGDVVLESTAQVSDNGDNDGVADNNESVTIDIAIRNNMTVPLVNARVRIFPESTDTIDCAGDNEAYYGTVPALASATNPASDRFTFHVAPSVACSNWQTPPKGRFTVVVTADDVYGANLLQTFSIDLDLDATSGSTYTLNQTFDSNPNWSTSATPDDDGACTESYVNNFHWCAACGNAGAGYGAWRGDAAFGTSGQNYGDGPANAAWDSSTLYTPVLYANGAVTVNFSLAYRTEQGYDGALVQYRLDNGAWTTLPFTSPAQAATTNQDYCSPLAVGATAWTGNGVSWTTTSTSNVPATANQKVQFRWRLGSDSVGGGTSYGGLGVDNVVITNLQQRQACEVTRNTGLPGCCGAISGLANNTATDLDPAGDTGVQVTWAQDPADWGDGGAGTRTYDVLRDGVPVASSLAYGTTSFTDNTGVNGLAYTYSVRYRSGCGSTTTTAGVTAADEACAVPVPSGSADLALAGNDLTWTALPNASHYDVVRGGVGALVSSGGDFASATAACVANDLAATTLTYGTTPAAGDAYWFLVRGVSCAGGGSYDDGTQQGSRDAEIAASPSSCP